MKAEEDVELGPAGVVETAEVERERAHRQQKDDDEDVGERGCEVALELAPEDGVGGVPGAHATPSALISASGVVSARKTSSSRLVGDCASREAGVPSATMRP